MGYIPLVGDICTDCNPFVGNRFFADTAPEATAYPYIVYSTISEDAGSNLKGSNGMFSERGRFDIAGLNKEDVVAVQQSLMNLFNGKTQTVGSRKRVTSKFLTGNSAYDIDPKVFRHVMDFNFTYYE